MMQPVPLTTAVTGLGFTSATSEVLSAPVSAAPLELYSDVEAAAEGDPNGSLSWLFSGSRFVQQPVKRTCTNSFVVEAPVTAPLLFAPSHVNVKIPS